MIVPTRDRREALRRCLAGVMALDCGDAPAPEVIVVDNGSTDGTIDMIRREFPTVVLLRNDRNLGAAQARNQALRHAGGRYAWFLDSDSVVADPACLSAMRALMEDHPDIGALGGELTRDASGRTLLKVDRFRFDGAVTSEARDPATVRLLDCDYLATCNCFARRDLLERIGGFDPDYFFLGEDADLGFRIRRAGLRTVCDGRTAVLHDVDLSARRSLYLKARNTMRFAIKNLPVANAVLHPAATIVLNATAGVPGRLRSGDPAAGKYAPGQGPFPLRLAAMAGRYAVSLAGAVAWNLWHLPDTLEARVARRNHIADAPEAVRDEGGSPPGAV